MGPSTQAIDERPLHVVSFDVDGSLFNKNYLKADKAERNIITKNQQLLDSINETKDNFSQLMVMIGSNRQSKASDNENYYYGVDKNGVRLFKGSCFPELPKVSAYLGGEFCPLLMADIYGHLEVGASYRHAMQDVNFDETHADWIFDSHKISILYAQMQHVANESYNSNPNQEIIFDFYDDCWDILCDDGENQDHQSLLTFFSKYRQFIPRNVTLRLFHYDGNVAEDNSITQEVGYIKGMGSIDTNYRQTVRDMASIAFNSHEKQVDFSLLGSATVDIGQVVTPDNLDEWRNRPVSDRQDVSLLPFNAVTHDVVASLNVAPTPEPVSNRSAQGPVKKVRALSFDVEGCLFHSGYFHSQDHDVYTANKPLIDGILATKADFDKVVLMNGSSRQSYSTDFTNKMNKRDAKGVMTYKPSCFPMFERLGHTLGATFDKLLMADIYGGLESGTSFDHAVRDRAFLDEDDHAVCVDDESKMTLLYAQMHKVAFEHPDAEEIVIDFYDDKNQLLEGLASFFQAHRDYMPYNVQLNLHHYAGKEVFDYDPVIGAGDIVADYGEQVRMMAQRACESKGYSTAPMPSLDRINIIETEAHYLEQQDAASLDTPVDISLPVAVPPLPVPAPENPPVIAPAVPQTGILNPLDHKTFRWFADQFNTQHQNTQNEKDRVLSHVLNQLADEIDRLGEATLDKDLAYKKQKVLKAYESAVINPIVANTERNFSAEHVAKQLQAEWTVLNDKATLHKDRYSFTWLGPVTLFIAPLIGMLVGLFTFSLDRAKQYGAAFTPQKLGLFDSQTRSERSIKTALKQLKEEDEDNKPQTNHGISGQ